MESFDYKYCMTVLIVQFVLLIIDMRNQEVTKTRDRRGPGLDS